MERQMCFRNAWHLAIDHDLTYVEGFFLAGPLPMLVYHAWCVDSDDGVWEPTILQPGDPSDFAHREEHLADATYFGIPFPDVEEVTKVLVQTETYGLLTKPEGRALIA